MPTRLERWMRSKLWAMTARTPSSLVPLAAQSRDEPLPYSTPANTTSGTFPSRSAWRRRRSACPRRRGIMYGVAALRHSSVRAFEHVVLDADIGEGAAHHHFVIAAPRAVLVEVGRLHLMLDQIFAGRASCRLDRAGRRDVVGGDLVAEQRRGRARPRCPLTGLGVHARCPRNRAGSAHRSTSLSQA